MERIVDTVTLIIVAIVKIIIFVIFITYLFLTNIIITHFGKISRCNCVQSFQTFFVEVAQIDKFGSWVRPRTDQKQKGGVSPTFILHNSV
jgi:hypothetical protein